MHVLTSVFKALSDRNRLRIVSALLKKDELCACQLTALIPVTGATASRHMGVLITSGLVESRKDGRWVYYRLRREQEDVNGLMAWVEARLKHDPQAERDAAAVDEILARASAFVCSPHRSRTTCSGDGADSSQGDVP